MYYFIDYGIVLISFFIIIGAQAFISTNYKKYRKINNKKKITGAEVARKILTKNGLDNVYVVEVDGNLTDHYDSNRKIIRLSKDIYNGESIASLSVAAHEVGHALQDKDNYSFLQIRNTLVPFVNFSTYLGYLSILIGLLTSSLNIIWIGLFFEVIIFIFQIVTLPVEFNASKRALEKIKEYNLIEDSEQDDIKKMLISAAFTYVASVITMVLQILRLLFIIRDRN